jgi:hypothetical protein
VKRLIDEGYETARRILLEKADEFERLAKGLLEYETLTGDEIRKVIAGEAADGRRRQPTSRPRAAAPPRSRRSPRPGDAPRNPACEPEPAPLDPERPRIAGAFCFPPLRPDRYRVTGPSLPGKTRSRDWMLEPRMISAYVTRNNRLEKLDLTERHLSEALWIDLDSPRQKPRKMPSRPRLASTSRPARICRRSRSPHASTARAASCS